MTYDLKETTERQSTLKVADSDYVLANYAAAQIRAETSRDLYFAAARNNQNGQMAVDLPLIGLAAATAGSILYEAHTDLTKGLGLATATLAGAGTYVNPQKRAEHFRNAGKSMSCISTSGMTLGLGLVGSASLPSPRVKIPLIMGGLTDYLAVAKAKLSAGITDKAAKSELENAVKAGDAALDLGQKAETALRAPGILIDANTMKVYGTLLDGLAGVSPDIQGIVKTIKATASASQDINKKADEAGSGDKPTPDSGNDGGGIEPSKVDDRREVLRALLKPNQQPKPLAQQIRAAARELASLSKPFAAAVPALTECTVPAGT